MLQPFILLLLLVNILVIILSIFRLPGKQLCLWPAALIIISVLHLLFDGFYQPLILAYIITLSLIIIGIYRIYKVEKTNKKGRIAKIIWGTIWRLVFVVCLGISVLLVWAYGNNDTFFKSLTLSNSTDFSGLDWNSAFEEMNDHMARDYAFGEWKAINWDSLYAHYAPLVKSAQSASDTAAFYLALRQYIFSIPDGHVSLAGNDFNQRKDAISGGFGFAAIRLDDDRVITHILTEDGPAANAGMAWGAEILTWNDQPVSQAIDNTPLLWASSPSATREGQSIWQQLLLTRAPIGDSINITFRNPNQEETQQAMMVAIDDSAATLKQALMMGVTLAEFDLKTSPVSWRILPEGYGYIKITLEMPTLGGLDPVGTVHKAVKAFKKANVPGIIIDIRLNYGGIDEMTPRMMANLVSEPMFYESVSMHNKKTGVPEIKGDIKLEPVPSPYTGPVAVLVSNMTGSTGEGFPLIMQKLNRGPVIGFYGTAGAFGMAGSTIKLPGGYSITYPNGASLDENGNIQLDSDHQLKGGMTPDVRAPITVEAMQAIFQDGRDYLLETAIQVLQNELKSDQ